MTSKSCTCVMHQLRAFFKKFLVRTKIKRTESCHIIEVSFYIDPTSIFFDHLKTS